MRKKNYKRKSLTEEHKRKIGLANSISLRGRKLPEEVKKKISERLSGRRLTDEHKRYLSKVFKGRPKSEEHRKKLSEALTGKPQPWNAGEKCHFWRGGISRKVIVACTICGREKFVRNYSLRILIHPYWCRSCSLKQRIIRPETRERSSLAHRKYTLDTSFFTEINTEKKAYWLGFFSGDGTITENKIRLRLANKDINHLGKFKRALSWTGKDYHKEKDNATEVVFRSSKMVSDLARYYVTPLKTFTIRFPDIPAYLEPHYIRGVFDADGCINRAKRVRLGNFGQKYISYGGEFNIEGNHGFLAAIQSRFVELELPAGSLNYSGKRINRIRYGGIKQLRKIYRYLYDNATVFLERKKELFEDVIKDYRHDIIKWPNDFAMVN